MIAGSIFANGTCAEKGEAQWNAELEYLRWRDAK
jgi:hypothetical protein